MKKIIVIPTPNSASVTLGYPSARGVIEAAVGQGHDFMLISSKVMNSNSRLTMSNSKACLAALLQRNIDSDMEVKTWEARGHTCWRFGVIVKLGRKSRWRLYHFKTTQTHLHFQAMLAAQAEAAALAAILATAPLPNKSGSLQPRPVTRL